MGHAEPKECWVAQRNFYGTEGTVRLAEENINTAAILVGCHHEVRQMVAIEVDGRDFHVYSKASDRTTLLKSPFAIAQPHLNAAGRPMVYLNDIEFTVAVEITDY